MIRPTIWLATVIQAIEQLMAKLMEDLVRCCGFWDGLEQQTSADDPRRALARGKNFSAVAAFH